MSSTGPTFRTPLEVRSIPRSRWETWIEVGTVPWTEFADDCRELAEIIHRSHTTRLNATRRANTPPARPASPARTLGTVGDNTTSEDTERIVVPCDLHGNDADTMQHDETVRLARLSRWHRP